MEIVELGAIIDGVYNDIHDRFRDNQIVLAHHYVNNTCPSDITVSQRNDRRYTIISFERQKLLVRITIRFFTRYLPDEEFYINLQEPQSFKRLANWLVSEITDGLKRGWSGREEKRIA
jgi:hypothetical protein